MDYLRYCTSLLVIALSACGSKDAAPRKETPEPGFTSVRPKATGEIVGNWISDCFQKNGERFRLWNNYSKEMNYSRSKMIFSDEKCEVYAGLEFQDHGKYEVSTTSEPTIWLLKLPGRDSVTPFRVLGGQTLYFGAEQPSRTWSSIELDTKTPFHFAQENAFN